ncbi:aquaporin [Deinococcus altitudinis]|uniref:aquaporin n=1 Tax=Deinococcus altitudinis TaxID=468914 RepID=UPI003891EBFC
MTERLAFSPSTPGQPPFFSPSFDRPLHGQPAPGVWHPRLYLAELVGTALLVVAGVSVVIVMFSPLSFGPELIPGTALRRAVTGLLFGLVGALVSVSAIGQVSGAHLNPSVTLAFLIEGKLKFRDALGYWAAQLLGGTLGGLALAAWGQVGRAAHWGDTEVEKGVPVWQAFAGEMLCTAALVVLIFRMGAHERTRRWTPWSIAPLFSLMVCLEAPLSGTSTNLARSLGPDLLAGSGSVLWLYLLAPLLGAAAVALLSRSGGLGRHRPVAARVAHPTRAADIQSGS